MKICDEKQRKFEKDAVDWICRITSGILILFACIDIVRFAMLGDKTAFITFGVIAVAFILLAVAAWKSRMPFLYLVIGAAAFVLYFNTNFSTSTYYFNWMFLVECIVAAVGGILGTGYMVWKKTPVGKAAVFPLLAAVLIAAGALGFWKMRYEAAHNADGQARDELWAVPEKYDGAEPEQAGTVEEVVYETKAYATDERTVTKTAYVYLPYGYSEEREYNILYLMHGTGDDEKYWLKTNPYNKNMLDHMIAEKLLETGLKKEYGINLKHEPRAEGEHGKPFLSWRPQIHYNVSHSGNYVVCILADQEVGIDVQIHKKANYERMLERMVSPAQRIEILEGEDPEKEFFRQWVLREAYIKWTGEGLSRDLRTIPMNEGTYALLDLDEGYSGAVWSMHPMEIIWRLEDIIL